MAVIPDPQKLLLPDPDYQPSFLSDKFFTIFTTTLGLVAVAGTRYALRRPMLSGVQDYLMLSALGAAGGYYGQTTYDNYNARKDAIFRHYIQLHPEDFPMPERKLIGELFPIFHPIR